MNKFLNNIRSTENEIPVSRKIRNTILILCLGIVLGTFSKFLVEYIHGGLRGGKKARRRKKILEDKA